MYTLAEEDNVGKYLVRNFNEVGDANAFVKSIPEQTGIEGYVIRLASGLRVKIKTEWYANLHNHMGSINSSRNLYEAVVKETIDDVRARFWDVPVALERIDDMVEKVGSAFSHMVEQVDSFYKEYKELGKREFALLAREELEPLFCRLAMRKYTGQEIDYREIMLKNRKRFGILGDESKLSIVGNTVL
jgi:T4 RnlA family RNA ligase